MNFKERGLPSAIERVEETKIVRVIHLKGPMDSLAVNDVELFIKRIKSQKGYELKKVLLDFKSAARMESSMVAEIIKNIYDLKKSHHKLGIVNFNDESRDMFEILKVDRLIHLYDGTADAMADLEKT